MRAAVTEPQPHSPLDTLLGASPRPVLRHWLSLLLLAIAGLGAATFFVRFVTGDNSPYYSAVIERGDMVPLVSERGTVRGSGETVVRAGIEGQITWVSSSEQVRRGEVLARIDDGEMRRQIAIDREKLAAAQTGLESARVSAQGASSQLARFESVWRRSDGRVPSLNEMETARADDRKASLAVEAAASVVEAARLQLRDDEARIAHAEVRAPFDGIVVQRQASPGQWIGERQPLFLLAAGLAPLTIEVPLSASPKESLDAGIPAKVRLDAMPDKVQPALLSLLKMAPPPQSGVTFAVFTLQKPDSRVRPGMLATVEIELPERRDVLLAPNAALSFEPTEPNAAGRKRPRIYLLSRNGEPRRIYVTLGGSDGERTEVFATGIRPGDEVITGWRDANTSRLRQNSDRKH